MKAAVGIDIGGTNTKIALLTDDGVVLRSQQLPTPIPSEEAGNMQDLLVQSLKDFLNHEETGRALSGTAHPSDIIGVGIGIAGLIDRKKGCVIKSPNIASVNSLPLREIFEKEFSLPVVLENDANTYAYGERWVGAGSGIENFILLTLGTGLGGGLIYHGELYEGPVEIGHVVIEPNGRFCPCGGRGCLESYASGRAIVDRAINSMEGGTRSSLSECCEGNFYKITPHIVYQAALDGDGLSREVFREAGYYLGIGVANLINLLNLEAVIIGGGLIGAWDILIDDLKQEAFRRAFKPLSEDVQILKSALTRDAGSIGAAGLVFRKAAGLHRGAVGQAGT